MFLLVSWTRRITERDYSSREYVWFKRLCFSLLAGTYLLVGKGGRGKLPKLSNFLSTTSSPYPNLKYYRSRKFFILSSPPFAALNFPPELPPWQNFLTETLVWSRKLPTTCLRNCSYIQSSTRAIGTCHTRCTGLAYRANTICSHAGYFTFENPVDTQIRLPS